MTSLPTIPAPMLLRSGAPARSSWPLDPSIIHLNHGSFGAVPSVVVEQQDALRRQADLSPVGWFPRVAELVGQARQDIAGFVGAEPEHTVFVPNASAAASVVFNSLQLAPGSEVLVTNHGYGAVTLGARRLAQRCGAQLVTLDVPLLADDAAVLALFAEAITERTTLVVVDQITSPTARLFPIAEIARLAHARRSRVLVDGAHGPGLIEHAAAAVGEADWWFGNLHKWPCAPRGSALLVTRAPDRDQLWPLIDSWGADLGYPERFDHQGTLDATSYLTSKASIDFIEDEFGWAATRHWMSDLADLGAAVIGEAMQPWLSAPALPVNPSPVGPLRLIRLPDALGRHREVADGLRARVLDQTGIECAFTSFDGVGYLRLAVHLYTEPSDFDAFVQRAVPLLGELADSL